MDNEIESPGSGTITAIPVKKGTAFKRETCCLL
ncbi:hypothetical protein [Candidatus Formimonas warabiya]